MTAALIEYARHLLKLLEGEMRYSKRDSDLACHASDVALWIHRAERGVSTIQTDAEGLEALAWLSRVSDIWLDVSNQRMTAIYERQYAMAERHLEER